MTRLCNATLARLPVEESFSGFRSMSATLAVAIAMALRIAELRGESWLAE